MNFITQCDKYSFFHDKYFLFFCNIACSQAWRKFMKQFMIYRSHNIYFIVILRDAFQFWRRLLYPSSSIYLLVCLIITNSACYLDFILFLIWSVHYKMNVDNYGFNYDQHVLPILKWFITLFLGFNLYFQGAIHLRSIHDVNCSSYIFLLVIPKV